MVSISMLELQHDISRASELTAEHGIIAIREGRKPVVYCLSVESFSELYTRLGAEEFTRVVRQCSASIDDKNRLLP